MMDYDFVSDLLIYLDKTENITLDSTEYDYSYVSSYLGTSVPLTFEFGRQKKNLYGYKIMWRDISIEVFEDIRQLRDKQHVIIVGNGMISLYKSTGPIPKEFLVITGDDASEKIEELVIKSRLIF